MISRWALAIFKAAAISISSPSRRPCSRIAQDARNFRVARRPPPALPPVSADIHFANVTTARRAHHILLPLMWLPPGLSALFSITLILIYRFSSAIQKVAFFIRARLGRSIKVSRESQIESMATFQCRLFSLFDYALAFQITIGHDLHFDARMPLLPRPIIAAVATPRSPAPDENMIYSGHLTGAGPRSAMIVSKCTNAIDSPARLWLSASRCMACCQIGTDDAIRSRYS